MMLQEKYDERREVEETGFIKLLPGTTNCGEDVSGKWVLAICPRKILELHCRRMPWLERELKIKCPNI
jgi:hypothetical protein